MTYVPVPPNAYDSGLIPVEVANDYFVEQLMQTPISDFMGKKPRNVIQVKEVMQGHGTSVPFALMRDIDDENVIIGPYQQMRGNEQSVKTYTDFLTLEQYRHADTLEGVPYSAQLVKIDLFNQLRPALITAGKKLLTKSVFFAATNGTATFRGPYYNTAASKPSFDRVKIAGSDDDRATYNGKAGLQAALDSMDAGKTYNTGGLSVSLIMRLKQMALSGSGDGNYESELKIEPTEVSTKNGFPEEKHILFIEPEAYLSLYNDPDWKSMMFQGMIRGQNQAESISGARFKGEVDGVSVYVCPELTRQRVLSADGNKNAAWGLFLGAQAFGMSWGMRPTFNEEYFDYKNNVGMCVSEIRGVKSLMFPSKVNEAVNVERGIIHVFTSV